MGFVHQLPTQLVKTFRSTLEEAGEADVFIYIVDAPHHDPVGQAKAVRGVLAGMSETRGAREIVVLSESDFTDPMDLAALCSHFPGLAAISCLTGEDVDELRAAVGGVLPQSEIEIAVVVPYFAEALLSRIHDDGELLAPVRYRGEGVFVHARVPVDIETAVRRGRMLSLAETK